MNFRDAQTVEKFVNSFARELKAGANHPAAIEAARKAAEAYPVDKEPEPCPCART
jgi:Flp pilus assembly protein TadB